MAQYNGNGHGQAPVYTADRPAGELFQELADEARSLISLEVTLAKAELSQKAAQAGKGAGYVAAGGFVIYAGFLALVMAAIIGLANFIAPWLSALIVGIVVALIGYIVVRKGMSELKGPNLVPKHTIATLKQDKDWAQDQVSRTPTKGGGA